LTDSPADIPRQKMHIGVVTLFPEMLTAVSEVGITGRAVEQSLVSIHSYSPRDFATDKHRTVDDRPYGGGPGMVMMVEPLHQAISKARQGSRPGIQVIYLSPQGQRFEQRAARRLLNADQGLFLIAGRYEGIDQRLIDHEVDMELSIGDFVLSGGELAAMVIIDALTRLIPGALGHEDSAEQDSFVNGLLDYPHYTRPEEVAGRPVPKVLLSGDHAAIARWRLKQSLGRTWLRRPDLLEQVELSKEQQQLLDEFITEHNEH